MKNVMSSPQHKAFHLALVECLRVFDDKLSPQEMLAVASQLVGQLIALQDQRKYTPEQMMTMVSRNIEIGNAEAIKTVLHNTQGNG